MLELLCILLLPLVLLWLAWHYMTKKYPVLKTTSHYFMSTMKWLWKDRTQKSGGGKLREPRVRYHDD